MTWAQGAVAVANTRRTEPNESRTRRPSVRRDSIAGSKSRGSDRFLPHRSLGLVPLGLVVHRHVDKAGRRQVPLQVHRMETGRDAFVRRINALPAGQGKSTSGGQESTELTQRGERWLGELHRVHAHQPIRDATSMP
jgi:hypothetical protein